MFENAMGERDRIAEAVLSDSEQVGDLVGSMIGPYRLEKLLATGGMGAVYKAERADSHYQQTVAIKILPGWATDPQTIARLKAERQILAGLRHPHITRLLDGGETGDGFPYLVTEFIDGLVITKYAEHNRLHINQRLELFLKVVDAMHHAHQKRVIHRDIKPSNILVDNAGQPHLLDFGIAKLLEAGAHDMTFAQTATGFTPMTPEYASPEQRAGEEVTTASDIYQLGLLLFYLLSGARTNKGATSGVLSMTRPSTAVLDHSQPDRLPDGLSPSHFARQLKGDLDTIVLKALREQPEDRYSSCARMAADIRRHLKGQAIKARPETLWSAMKRLSRHHPLAATLATSLAVVLVIWATSLFFYAKELEVQRDEATRQATRANQVKNVLIDIFRRSDPLQADTIGGKSVSVWDSLDAATAQARNQLAGQPEIQAELFATLSVLYSHAGEKDKAKDLLFEAVGIYESLGDGFEIELAVNQAEFAGFVGMDDYTDARSIMIEALHVLPMVLKQNPVAAIDILLDAGNLENIFGEFDSALIYSRQARSIFTQYGMDDYALEVDLLSREADVLIGQDKLEIAAPLLIQALDLSELHFDTDHRRITETLSALGSLERRRGNFDVAIAYNLRLVRLIENDSATTYSSLLSAKNNLALAYGAAGRVNEEQQLLREQITLWREVSGNEGGADLAITIKNLASSLHLTGDYEQAIAALSEAGELFVKHFPASSPFQALPHFTLALIYLDTDRPALAETESLVALNILESALGAEHFQVQVTRCTLAEAYRSQGRLDESFALAEPAMQGILASGTNTPVYIKRCGDTLAALENPTGS